MSEKIMVVDDEPGILALMEIMLRRKGYDVITARDAYQALALLSSEKPDLFILDVMMTGLTGLEFCQELRNRPDTANIPVLILSCRTDLAAVRRGLAAGANDYLPKTSLPRQIVGRVESLLNNGDTSAAHLCSQQ